MYYDSFYQQSSCSKMRLRSRNGSRIKVVHKSIMDRESELIPCPDRELCYSALSILHFPISRKKRTRIRRQLASLASVIRTDSNQFHFQQKRKNPFLPHSFHYFESVWTVINIFPPVSLSETFAAGQFFSKAFVLLLSWKGRRGSQSELKQRIQAVQ